LTVPRASLLLHFRLWLGAGAAGLLILGAGMQFGAAYQDLSRQQDTRLESALAAPQADAVGVAWRVSRPGGERLQGEAAMPAYAWPDELQDGRARLYFTRIGGTLARAVVVLRRGPGSEDVLVQVAEPLARRMPGIAALATPLFLWFAAGVLLMFGVAAGSAITARRWIADALRDFDGNGGPRVAPPAELGGTLDDIRHLQQEQRQWVDEQRRFLADAAHQLRTPMAVLRTQLQSALAAADDPRVILGDMLHTVDRATGLANQLLSLTRIEQLKRTGQLQSMRVGDAVHGAVVELSPLVGARRLDFSLEGEEFEAPADAVMLGEVLRNLVANAIHHSGEGARIGIVMRPAPFREIVVWDDGPGVDDALKPRLFTPFTAARGGVGLGLSICQQIAEAMEASVHLYNRVEEGRTVGVDAVIAWRPAP
jgi:two-component system, OmpR family, sensor histidine kinase TctE